MKPDTDEPDIDESDHEPHIERMIDLADYLRTERKDREWGKYNQAKIEYTMAVQPFIKMLHSIEIMMPKRYILKLDGSLEIPEDQGWPQWAIEQKAKIEECIKSVKDKYLSKFQKP